MNLIEKRIEQVRRLAEADRLAEASAAAQLLVTDFPNDPEAWRWRAYVFALLGQYRGAIKAISSAIDFNSREPHYYWTRGKYLMELGENEPAIQDLTEALRLCDEHNSSYYREAAYLLRAEAHLRLKHYDDARRDCENVSDDATIWVGTLRSKRAILSECE